MQRAFAVGLVLTCVSVALYKAGENALSDHKYSGSGRYTQQGIKLCGKGDYDRAMESFHQALQLDPEDHVAYNGRGGVWFAKGDVDRAISDCSKAIELAPDFAKAYHNRAHGWYIKRAYKKALDDCNKVIALGTIDDRILIGRGMVWEAMEKYESALADYNHALEINPKSHEAARRADQVAKLLAK